MPFPAHPVEAAVRTAACRLLNLKLARIAGEPHMDDAAALQSDLLAIAAIIDPIIETIGDYAESHFGKVDMELFRDQVRGAVEGNATFEIEAAGRRLVEDYRERRRA